jgi:hypothetical protein
VDPHQHDSEADTTGRRVLEKGSEVALAFGAALVGRLPQRIRRALDDRLFSAIFQVTRVTNDHYGWRPEEPGGRGDRRDR